MSRLATIVLLLALAWPSALWNRLAGKFPSLAGSALTTIGSRLQDMQARVIEMSHEQVEQRIAHTLLRLAKQAGKKTGDGIEIDFPISRQDIAEMASLTTETTIRVIRRFSEQGILRIIHGKIFIDSTAQLEHLLRS